MYMILLYHKGIENDRPNIAIHPHLLAKKRGPVLTKQETGILYQQTVVASRRLPENRAANVVF
jgi:hypothetical protein